MTRKTTTYAHEAAIALDAFNMATATLEPISMGHINATYEASNGRDAFILQWVNPIFAPEINHDIVAVVAHLKSAGILAPMLQRTRTGQYWHTDAKGGTWRLMEKIQGHTTERCTTPAQCRTVGTMLGRFHRALSSFQHTFVAPRLGVHDTARHLARLEDALTSHADHVAFSEIAPLARRILQAGHSLPLAAVAKGPERIVHGDPKISNFIFNGHDEAIALVDLDTLASMPLATEMGDALRSWCSPGGEDPKAAGFEMSHFRAAITGYKQGVGDLLLPHEIAGLAASLGTIATELAARFARDALEESYFGWDDSRFGAAWEHNLERAKSQWILAQSFAANLPEAQGVVAQVFGLTASQPGDRATAG